MKASNLVSVIMPVYNAELYVSNAIESVLIQSYDFIELLVVNDGSTDSSEEKIKKITDPRIRYFFQPNKGVSSARNLGLKKMKGNYFCFLDSDDVMPPRSIESRLELFFNDPTLEFVSGSQIQKDASLNETISVQVPSFRGNPRLALAILDSRCFINCGTWLIKLVPNKEYRFNEGWSHCEDLAFFFSLSKTGNFNFTEEVAQFYRRNNSSAMGNLPGLMFGYQKFYFYLRKQNDIKSKHLLYLKCKIAKIMILSFLKARKFKEIVGVLDFLFYL